MKSSPSAEERAKDHIVEIGWNERVAQAGCGCRVYREAQGTREVLLLRPCKADVREEGRKAGRAEAFVEAAEEADKLPWTVERFIAWLRARAEEERSK